MQVCVSHVFNRFIAETTMPNTNQKHFEQQQT
jgi:hypothetical protein